MLLYILLGIIAIMIVFLISIVRNNNQEEQKRIANSKAIYPKPIHLVDLRNQINNMEPLSLANEWEYIYDGISKLRDEYGYIRLDESVPIEIWRLEKMYLFEAFDMLKRYQKLSGQDKESILEEINSLTNNIKNYLLECEKLFLNQLSFDLEILDKTTKNI